jgi:hypothetical protein
MAQPKPFDHTSEHDGSAAVLTPVESRQGIISGRVLAAIAFVIIYSVWT